MDVATLGISVDSTGAVKATGELDKLGNQASTTERQVGRMAANTGRSLGTAATSASRFQRALGGQGIRKASLQFSQVAQQAASGTGFVRALAIQLPDLTLGFGTVGIAAGVVAGALLPLAANLFSTGDSAEVLGDQLESLSNAMGVYRDAVNGISSSADLRDQFTVNLDEARELLDIQRQVAEVQAQRALSSASNQVGSQFGDFDFGASGDDIRDTTAALQDYSARFIEIQEELLGTTELSNAQIDALEEEKERLGDLIVSLDRLAAPLNELQSSLGLTQDEAIQVGAALAEFSSATSIEDQAQAARDLAREIFEATDGLADADDETLKLYGSLLDVVEQGLNFASLNLSAPIAEAVGFASALADELSRARATQGEIGRLNQESPDFFDPRGEGGPQSLNPDVSNPQPAARRRAEQEAARLSRASGSAGGGSRGGGGSSGVSEAQRAAQREQLELERERDRILDGLKTSQDEYNDSVAQADRLLKAGVLGVEDYSAHIEQLREELTAEQFAPLIEGIETVSDSIAGAIVQGENLGDAFKGILAQMGQDIISSNIQSLLKNALIPQGVGAVGGGGLFGTLLGGLFAKGAAFSGGKVTPFASGGVVSSATAFPMSGGVGVMGEAGPEAIMPLTRGPGGKLGVQSSGGSSGGEVGVSVSFDDNGNLQAKIEQVSGNVVARETPGIQAGAKRDTLAHMSGTRQGWG